MSRRLLCVAFTLSFTFLAASASAQRSQPEEADAGEIKKDGTDASVSTEVDREPAPPATPARSDPFFVPSVRSPPASFWSPTQKTIGASLMLLGVASVGTGFVVGGVAIAKYDDLSERGCSDKECPEAVVATGDLDEAQRLKYAMVGTLLGGIGTFAAGILVHAAASIPVTGSVAVKPVVGLNQIGVIGSF